MDELKPSLIETIAASSQKHKKAVMGFFVLCLVAISTYYINDQYQQNIETKALNQLYLAERLNQANIAADDYVNVGKKEEKVNVDTAQAEEKLKAVMVEFPKTTAATQAALTLSELYKTKGNLAGSIEVLETSVKNNSSSDFLKSTLELRLSGFYEMNNQCDKAVSVLEDIKGQKNNKLRPEALLRMALCFESLNQKDKAVEHYKVLTQEHLDSTQAQQAQKYLKMIETNS